jgi:hypothetical protein
MNTNYVEYKIVDSTWFTNSRGTIGIVKTLESNGKYMYLMSPVSGFNQKLDEQTCAEWGSRLPDEVGIALFGKEV